MPTQSFPLRCRFWLEHRLLVLAVAIIPRLPLGAVRLLASLLGRLVCWLDYSGKKTTIENLRAAFPEATDQQRKIWRLECYQNFAKTFAEFFWSPRLNRENLEKYVSFSFASEASLRAMQTGAVIATPHAGNFEWLSLAAAFQGFDSLVVAENFKNPALTRLFTKLRQSSGQIIIPQEGAVLRMFKHLKRGGRVALLTDLTAPPEQSAAVISCFGLKTSVTMAHAVLAQRSGRPILPVIALPAEAGRYELTFLEPIIVSQSDFPQDVTQATWDAFEHFIRKNPPNWLWIYKHWRFLPAGQDAAGYPSYSNGSSKFQRLLRRQEKARRKIGG